MSLLNLPVHQNPNFFCKVSGLKTNSPPSNRFKKNPSRDNFNFLVKIPFWSVSNGRKSQIFARFGHPSNRRNALRKKLIEDEKCIELYTIEDGVDKVGFYSLEMAPDLELDPKQYHIIAFEDPGDSKNFCYIIQAHMEMIGNGRAFVVARPPKDTFREARANGFSVTVIRKGELRLNVDQTLEEVDDEIIELGSKIYHDKIMRERSVDISTLMKGVFATGKPTKKRRSRRLLSKPTKR